MYTYKYMHICTPSEALSRRTCRQGTCSQMLASPNALPFFQNVTGMLLIQARDKQGYKLGNRTAAGKPKITKQGDKPAAAIADQKHLGMLYIYTHDDSGSS